ncbi:MAG: hypothetical protein RIC55_29545 [Pirellulaceae bacterium]
MTADIDALMTEIEQLIVEQMSTDDADEQRRLADAAIEKAEQLVARRRDSAEAHYMLAVCWYHHPDRSRRRSEQVRQHLDIALGLDHDHQFANQYLAFINLDQSRYEAALARLEKTDFDYFDAIGQPWRALKARELLVVCRLRTGRSSFDIEELHNFIEEYLDQFEEDPSATTWPVELRSCAEWLFERGDDVDNPILETILSFLAEIDFLDSLENQALLDAWKKHKAV